MMTFKNILVPIDFSSPSDHALTVAVELAKQYDAALTALHVFDIPPSYAGMDISPRNLLAPMLEAARKQLEEVVADARRAIPNTSVLFLEGSPWREILSAIAQKHVDLVVMGTHGRRGVGRALLGSVTEKIVRLSPVPVLTVRAPTDEPAEARSTD